MGSSQGFRIFLWLGISLGFLGIPLTVVDAASSKKLPLVAKWSRFERAFTSSIAYPNPLQNATLRVQFTSPLGETHEVFGFWDGNKLWRVRFSPWQIGRWRYSTSCSDAANRGLHERSGEFLCTAPGGSSRFDQHGPVRLSRDGRRLEHIDGTPFFWVADTAWNGPQLASQEDWQIYARTRASQQFNVIQCGASGADAKKQSAYTLKPALTINPAYFQGLDRKLETLRRAGLLSAIRPFDGESTRLADDELALLARYMIARWGTEPVAWLVAPDASQPSTSAERWRRLGQVLFPAEDHAPVILLADQSPSLWQQFRDQYWIDALACASSSDAPPRSAKLPGAATVQPAVPRPLRIACLPTENEVPPGSAKRIDPQDIRRAAFWNLCLDDSAGISYAARNVAQWNSASAPRQAKQPAYPEWRKSLYLSAAREMSHLAGLFDSLEYWRLQASPKLVAAQPGEQEPRRWISAAATEAKDLTLVYVPEDRTLDLTLDALPSSPNIVWFNPRTGENSPAVAVVGGNTCQFPTPDPGDWLLVIREGKPNP